MQLRLSEVTAGTSEDGQMKYLRPLIGLSRKDYIRNDTIRSQLGQTSNEGSI
jgi:hypothetical protein